MTRNLIVALLLAGGLLAQARPPAECGSGPNCRPELWGTVPDFNVGNPNSCPRRDRTVFRYDLSDCLNAGKVKRATLKLDGKVIGYFDAHVIQLERFLREHMVLGEFDLISNDVEVCGQHSLSQGPFHMEIDVTGQVNALLAEGVPSITFRLLDLTVEKLGNRNGVAECVSFSTPGMLDLEIEK